MEIMAKQAANQVFSFQSLDSSNERGSFASGKIQCTFTAELPDTSARAEASYSLSVSTGSFNASKHSL